MDAALPDPPAAAGSSSLWLRRLWAAFQVILLIWMGMVLIVMPWTPAWGQNSLIASRIALRDLIETGFVRGAVTGLGVLNLILGFWEALRYKE